MCMCVSMWCVLLQCSISISQCGSSVDPISAVGSSQAAAERLLELTKRTCDQMKV